MRDFLLVLSYCFKGDLMFNVFMSTCFVLTLSCLRAGLCGGWVSGLLWWGVGGVPVGEIIFIVFAGG